MQTYKGKDAFWWMKNGLSLMPGKGIDIEAFKRDNFKLRVEILSMAAWCDENVEGTDFCMRCQPETVDGTTYWVVLCWVRDSPPYMSVVCGSESAAREAVRALQEALDMTAESVGKKFTHVPVNLDAPAQDN